jgi:hypothetical protein
LAYGWTVVNCAYVYLFLHGRDRFRIESSIWILVAVLALRVLLQAPRAEGDRGPEPLSPLVRALVTGIAVGLWLWLLLPRLSFPFLSDDYVFLRLYESAIGLGRTAGFFRPLFALAFWLVGRVGGGSPVAFHAVSLVLHLAAAFLAFSLARRTSGSATLGTVCFIVFLLNPLQLEATLWVSGLQEELWTTLLLAAVWVYTTNRELSASALCGTALFVVGALLSKETAMCFVLLLPAADFFLFGFNRGPLLRRAYAVLAAIAVVYLLARFTFAATQTGFFVAPSRYFLKQLIDIPYAFFAQPWTDAAAVSTRYSFIVAVALVTLLVIRVLGRGNARQMFAGPAIILITTLPLYGFFFVKGNLASARYIYFAAAGWGVLMAQLVTAVRKPAFVAAWVAVIVAMYAVCLRVNLQPWLAVEDMMAALRRGASAGEPLSTTVDGLKARYGNSLKIENGIPSEYDGVWILLNGYEEFRRLNR